MNGITGVPDARCDAAEPARRPLEEVRDLLRRFKQGDSDAILPLYRPWKRSLARVARRFLRDMAETENVAWETMEILWDERERIPPEPVRALAFACRIARQHAIDRHRWLDRLHADPDSEVRLAHAHAPTLEESRIEIGEMAIAILETMFDELPGRTQSVALVHGYCGLSISETAVDLRISEKTVKKHWALARRCLRARFG